jgi:hypothetical protein
MKKKTGPKTKPVDDCRWLIQHMVSKDWFDEDEPTRWLCEEGRAMATKYKSLWDAYRAVQNAGFQFDEERESCIFLFLDENNLTIRKENYESAKKLYHQKFPNHFFSGEKKEQVHPQIKIPEAVLDQFADFVLNKLSPQIDEIRERKQRLENELNLVLTQFGDGCDWMARNDWKTESKQWMNFREGVFENVHSIVEPYRRSCDDEDEEDHPLEGFLSKKPVRVEHEDEDVCAYLIENLKGGKVWNGYRWIELVQDDPGFIHAVLSSFANNSGKSVNSITLGMVRSHAIKKGFSCYKSQQGDCIISQFVWTGKKWERTGKNFAFVDMLEESSVEEEEEETPEDEV